MLNFRFHLYGLACTLASWLRPDMLLHYEYIGREGDCSVLLLSTDPAEGPPLFSLPIGPSLGEMAYDVLGNVWVCVGRAEDAEAYQA